MVLKSVVAVTPARDFLSIVVPVYNCAECLRQLCQRLGDTLRTMPVDYEIILVEDRGRDRSWEVICELAESRPNVRGIRLSRNFGQHPAITAGIAKSRGDSVVVMDCDLQDPPEVIPALYAAIQTGADIVFARPRRRGQGLARRTASALYFRLLNKVSDTRFDGFDGFFGALSMVSRKVADAFLQINDKDRQYTLAIQWLGFESTIIEYDRAVRPHGRSSYTFSALVRQAVKSMLFQTTAFLRWIIYLGFLAAFLGFMASLIVSYRYFFREVPPGWTSLFVLGLLMGGANIAAVGVVGLYISRIFEQVRGLPLYLIDQEVGGTVSPEAGMSHRAVEKVPAISSYRAQD